MAKEDPSERFLNYGDILGMEDTFRSSSFNNGGFSSHGMTGVDNGINGGFAYHTFPDNDENDNIDNEDSNDNDNNNNNNNNNNNDFNSNTDFAQSWNMDPQQEENDVDNNSNTNSNTNGNTNNMNDSDDSNDSDNLHRESVPEPPPTIQILGDDDSNFNSSSSSNKKRKGKGKSKGKSRGKTKNKHHNKGNGGVGVGVVGGNELSVINEVDDEAMGGVGSNVDKNFVELHNMMGGRPSTPTQPYGDDGDSSEDSDDNVGGGVDPMTYRSLQGNGNNFDLPGNNFGHMSRNPLGGNSSIDNSFNTFSGGWNNKQSLTQDSINTITAMGFTELSAVQCIIIRLLLFLVFY